MKALISKKSVKMKIEVDFYFDNFFFFKYKRQWTLTNLFLRSKKTLYIDTIQSLTGTNIGLIWQLCADSSDFLLWVPK